MTHYIRGYVGIIIFSLMLLSGDAISSTTLLYHQELVSPITSDPLSLYSLKNIRSHYAFPIDSETDLLHVSIEKKSEPDQVSIIGKALFYPNPFRLHEGAQLGFELSENADVDIRIYDMRLQEVYRKMIHFDSSETYKKVSFDAHSFDSELSSGVYLFVITQYGNILSKGKFAIVP